MDARWIAVGLALLLGEGRAWAVAELGVGVDVSADLSDRALPQDYAGFQPGPSLRLPLRLSRADGVGLRATARLTRATGWDTVVWQEAGGTLTYVSTDHEADLLSGELTLGPELRLGASRGAKFQPYLGAEAGALWAHMTHQFSGAAADSLTGGDESKVLTSSQLRPTAGAHTGIRWSPSGRVALELEAGYNVSFLNEVVLEGTAGVREATEAALGLNAVRLGAGATFSLGDGKSR
jgi:hypothetical protein